MSKTLALFFLLFCEVVSGMFTNCMWNFVKKIMMILIKGKENGLHQLTIIRYSSPKLKRVNSKSMKCSAKVPFVMLVLTYENI